MRDAENKLDKDKSNNWIKWTKEEEFFKEKI